MVVSHLERTRSRKQLLQVLCLIFHTYLEYVIQTVEQREKRCQQDKTTLDQILITSVFKSTEYYVHKKSSGVCLEHDAKLDLVTSTEDRQSRQSMSRCLVIAQGAPYVWPLLGLLRLLLRNPSSRDRLRLSANGKGFPVREFRKDSMLTFCFSHHLFFLAIGVVQ